MENNTFSTRSKPKENAAHSPLIEVERATFTYPGAATPALRGVSLSVRTGEHLCILGGNGSGKSTLLQLMNALLLPSGGTVRVAGTDTRAEGGVRAAREAAAMVFQHPEDQMVTSVVYDDVAFGPENLGVEPAEIARRVEAALAAVGMAELANADPADLSGGQRQRVAIAGALAMEPRVLLLDEPGAMLDAEGRAAVRRLAAEAAERGMAVVHVTHFMDDALAADRVAVMRAGRVELTGTPGEVFARGAELAELGIELPFRMRVEARVAELHAGVVAAVPGAVAGPIAAPTAEPVAMPAPTAPAEPPAIAFTQVSYSYAAARSARKRPRRGPLARLAALSKRGASTSAKPVPLALDGVDLEVEPGTCCALVGRTGAGKSTAIELACALKVPLAGSVSVRGIDTADMDRRRALRRAVGYVSQLPERQLFAETVRDDIAFGPRNLGLSEDEVALRVREALCAVGLDPTDEALLARSPFSLSGGQQRCVAVAGVLAMGQPVLVLDEPMAGLDPAGRAQMRVLLRRLKDEGTALLLVTHSMDDVAELAERVVALARGRVVAAGEPHAVFAEELALLEAGGEPRLPGLPPALDMARELARCGDARVRGRVPITLEELARLLAATDAEGVRHGA